MAEGIRSLGCREGRILADGPRAAGEYHRTQPSYVRTSPAQTKVGNRFQIRGPVERLHVDPLRCAPNQTLRIISKLLAARDLTIKAILWSWKTTQTLLPHPTNAAAVLASRQSENGALPSIKAHLRYQWSGNGLETAQRDGRLDL